MSFKFNFNNVPNSEISKNQSLECGDKSSVEYNNGLCDFLLLTNKNLEVND